MDPQAIEANVAALAKRLEQSPDDAQGWIMLGRSYVSLEKYTDASNAYAKASALKPDDADLLGDYAFALAMTNGRQLQGQPFELIKKALQLDPKNIKALDLAATAEFQAKNYKQAIDYWQKALELVPADAGEEPRTRLSKLIEEAKSLSTAGSK
jgi:cytochrome c-type biogenesis protein CcmH